MALRKGISSASKIKFTIVKVIDKTNRHDPIHFEISDELSDFKNDIVQNELVKMTLSERQDVNDQTDSNENMQVVDGSAKSQYFFQDDNPLAKKYTTTRIKSRNFLSNTAYVGINNEDFYNENFIFDVHLLVTKNLNPFSLDKNKHEMIYMLWKACMPQRFYKHICKQKNFLYLNSKNVMQPKVLEIINDFLNENKENYKDLRNNLSSYKSIF